MVPEPNEIRPYQREAAERIKQALDRQPKVCVHLATGTGKSVVIRELVSQIHARRVLILTDRLDIAHQLYDFLSTDNSINVGVFRNSNENDWLTFDICISTIQALNNNLNLIHKNLELVVFYDVNAKRIEPIINQPNISRRLKFILFTSAITKQNIELFGEPVFTYSISNAISDGIAHPVEFVIGPTAHKNGLVSTKRIVSILSHFKQRFEEGGGTALIICKNISEAELVLKICQDEFPRFSPMLLNSQIKDVNDQLRVFAEGSGGNIGIVVEMFIGLQVNQLTDVVLLRSFNSRNLFLRAICLLTLSPNSNYPRRVWDYGGNRKYFDEEMGTISEDNWQIGNLHDYVDLENLAELEHHQQTKFDEKQGSETEKIENISEYVQTEEKIASSLVRKLVNPCDDKPSEEDLLGRSGLVNILKGIVDRDARKHLIIALFGRWGSGKSSVINLLKDQYKSSSDTSFIIFNAWQEEHSASMAASLADKISTELYESKSFFKQLNLTFKYRIIESKWTLLFEFCLAIIVALVASLSILPLMFGQEKAEWFSYLTGPLLLMLPVAKSYFSHPFTAKVRELSKKSDFSAHLGVGHQIREQLSHLLKVYPVSFLRSLINSKKYPIPDKHKYIIVVDDLDRCSDNKIVETLEAIQLIVDLDGICVILAVDHQILIDAVASRYNKQRAKLKENEALSLAREFLGKILQLTICLDRPSETNREKFIYSRLYNKIPKSENEELPEKESVIEKSIVQKVVNYAESAGGSFDFDDLIDIEEEAADASNEYLADSHLEFEFFNLCTTVFGFHNPRSLIRMHNAITLLKGLYPSITEDNKTIKQYIFFVFWFEKFSSVDEITRSTMRKAILIEAQKHEDEAVDLLFKKIGADELGLETRRHILYKVCNLTLPSGLELEVEGNKLNENG
jgi:hypothetical protein